MSITGLSTNKTFSIVDVFQRSTHLRTTLSTDKSVGKIASSELKHSSHIPSWSFITCYLKKLTHYNNWQLMFQYSCEGMTGSEK